MKKTIRFLSLLTCIGLIPAASVSEAQTYIKGTQVSYYTKIDKTKGTNDSAIFIDEANDTTDENYVAFFCQEHVPVFYWYSSQNLATKKQDDDGTSPPLTIKVDNAAPLKMASVTTSNDKGFDPKTLALSEKFWMPIVRMFQTAENKIVISTTRYDGKTVKATFYPKGFDQALKLVNHCN